MWFGWWGGCDFLFGWWENVVKEKSYLDLLILVLKKNLKCCFSNFRGFDFGVYLLGAKSKIWNVLFMRFNLGNFEKLN